MLKPFAVPVAIASLLTLVVAGCGGIHPSGISSGAPHLVVCGETLSTGAAGPVVYDIASHHVYPTAHTLTVGGVIYVRVSNSCTTGRVVKISPPAAFATVRTVRAADGRVVLVELRPGKDPVAVLSATTVGKGNEGEGVTFLRLDIASAPAGAARCPTASCQSTTVTHPDPARSRPVASPGHALGTVVGGIDACSGLPAPTAYVAGTVQAIRATATQAPSPINVVATQTVSAGGEYRFVLSVGHYVLEAVRNDPTSNTDLSSVSVTAIAGRTVRVDVPDDCK